MAENNVKTGDTQFSREKGYIIGPEFQKVRYIYVQHFALQGGWNISILFKLAKSDHPCIQYTFKENGDQMLEDNIEYEKYELT